MLKKISLLFTVVLLCCMAAQAQPRPAFQIVPLGVKGGIDESNLSAYMVAEAGTRNYVCLDAGTLHYGILQAVKQHTFNVPVTQVLRQYIKGYLISHSHLDHLSGLIINSPDDSAKTIYAFEDCINTFKTHYFTNKSWSNFANEGEAPQLKKYTYQVLQPQASIPVAGTGMQVTAYPLSHANLTSTAFLLNSKGSYLLYLGDTGPDEVEKSQNLQHLWQAIAPLVKNKSLKALMIEVSFPDEQPDKSLFGHLTPRWLMQELKQLESFAGTGSLKGFKVIITHVKPPEERIAQLRKQLQAENTLQLNLIFPEQGKAIDL
ncbi:3',5'-cyclic-nucleotide phosphodiesterase [Mucilaginibacter koreensis]